MLKAPSERWILIMPNTVGDTDRSCIGQAGKPDMHGVNWGATQFTANSFSVPQPRLVLVDSLYIDWGTSFPNLTPLPLYGSSLSFVTLAASGGNIELMYDALHGWIPIIDHLYSTNPRSPWRKSHVYDFAVIWKRAELALQRHLGLPRRYSHDDVRFRQAWIAGNTDEIAPRLTDRQRSAIGKRKSQWLETSHQETPPSSGFPSQIRVTPGVDESQSSSPPTVTQAVMDMSPSDLARPTTPSSPEMEEHDSAFAPKLDKGAPVMLMWSPGEDGSRCLTIVRTVDSTILPCKPQPSLITALSKNTSVCPELRFGDQKCSRCFAGMCPPGIHYCTGCWGHWIHIHCAPISLHPSGTVKFLCLGCTAHKSYHVAAPVPPLQYCVGCSHLVVDNDSAAYCGGCQRYYHALCAMACSPLGSGCFPKEFFSYSSTPRASWRCATCEELLTHSPSPDLSGDSTPCYRLPLRRTGGPPSAAVEERFYLQLSLAHPWRLACCWRQHALGTVRHSAEFRRLLQSCFMFFPQVDKQTLLELSQNPQCHLLVLQSEAECGSHWISFLLFGQNDEGGIPVILLHAVQPLFQSRGIGRWGLHLVYRQCRKTRTLLLNTQAETELGFYSHMGFSEFQQDIQRFKSIGDVTWRRTSDLGAIWDISLSTVVVEHQLSHGPSNPSKCRGRCPMGAMFRSIPGTDVCFVATVLHMLLSVPQMVAHFSAYEDRPHSTGALVGRCLAHLWRSVHQEDPDGPALIPHLRARLTGDFGHCRPRKGKKSTGGTFSGQQDIGDFETALGKALLEDIPQATDVGQVEISTQPLSYASLVNSPATEVRYCDKCRSRTRRDVMVTWLLPVQDQPVRSLSELLGPILTTHQSPDTPLDQPGCKRRNCTHLEYTVHTSIRELAPVIQLAISRGLHAPDVTTLGARTLHVVDVPLHFSIEGCGEVRQYVLRSVGISSGGPTIAAGHYSVGKVFKDILEHCSQTSQGASISSHSIPGTSFLRLSELCPPLPLDHVIATAWYSWAVEDEHLDYRSSDDTRWINHGLPELEPVELPLSPEELLPRAEIPQQSRLRRPIAATLRKTLIDSLRDLVAPEPAIRILRGPEPLHAHLSAVRAAVRQSEQVDVPVLFWLQPDGTGLTTFEAELQSSTILSLHTVSTSSGRGRELSLSTALAEMARSRQQRDPFTSTNALPAGMYQSSAGAQLMAGVVAQTGVEVTGGASLLVSEPGVVTPCHFHGPGVLNVCFSIVSKSRHTSGLEFRRPELNGPVLCVKQYVLFVTASLAEAGISLYDFGASISLASLVLRIQELNPAAREKIRWFYCELDGSGFNALYMPATMSHHVSTIRCAPKLGPFLYVGLATEVLPMDPATRKIVLGKLEHPVPSKSRTRTVASSKHIALQPTSAHSLALLRYFERHPSAKVSDFAPYHLAREWALHRRIYANAQALAAEGDLGGAERILLAITSEPARNLPAFVTLRSAVLQSQQALSEALLTVPFSQKHTARIARSFELGMATTAVEASLLPLLLSSSPHSAIVMDSHLSVGIDGDAA